MAFTSSKRRQAVRLLLCAALCASAALVSGSARAGGDKKDGKGDLEPFQGGWSVTSINKDKQDIPEELIKELKVSFKGNKLNMSFMGKEIAGTCTVDPSKKPKEVNFKIDGQDETFGIYTVDGDTLKLCMADTKENRPKDFQPADGLTLIILKK